MMPTDARGIRALAAQHSPDPFPPSSAPERTTTWLYAPGQFPLGLLHRLVAEGFAAGRNVHYARNHALPSRVGRFRRAVGAGEILDVAATGRIELDPESTARVQATGDDHHRLLGRVEAAGRIAVVVSTRPGEAAALADAAGRAWQASTDGTWRDAEPRQGTAAAAPHTLDEPTHVLLPRDLGDGMFDAGATVLGHIAFSATAPGALRTGESRAEAASGSLPETRTDPAPAGDGAHRTGHRQGFRYLWLPGADDVRIEANVRPVGRTGAFVCSDQTLNDIWAVSAYTTRLCMQGLNLDGVKRDRMPWVGDQALALSSNAFSAADPVIAADSLVALGSPQSGYVNGLADYSLWWVIAQGVLRRYFGEAIELDRQAEMIERMLEPLLAEVDDDGVFRPSLRPADGGPGPVLIDWGVDCPPGRTLTALQILFVWALRTAAETLRRAGRPAAETLDALHRRARTSLLDLGWDGAASGWREFLGSGSVNSPYPNLLAILAGLHGDTVPAAVLDRADPRAVRTPYMAGFALMAQGAGGRRRQAVDTLRALWEPMLAAGATTFWEEFTDPGGSAYEMYGRPFGKSLCHAWSASPAALLPELVLGIAPVDDGWSTVRIAPDLAGLEWAAAVVPTPHGDLTVTATPTGFDVTAPPGVTVLRDNAPTTARSTP